MSPVTNAQVLNHFLTLDNNKASLDIPNAMLRMIAPIISPVFTNIYNESFNTGIVPDILKISRITPIYKSGTVTNPNNYRPISVLSAFSKILERIVYNQLESYLVKNNIFFKYQFRFRKGHSTEQAILEITDSLKTAIDKKEITCGLFLDFSKAFDTVNFEILLSKLDKYGVRGIQHDWFKSYLTNRKQYVRIGKSDSDMLTMTCGVPQGSTLGPLLFLIYINDMPNCSNKLQFRIFADDTNVFYSNSSIDEVESVMNIEIEKLFRYCATNKLSINLKKTNFMLITNSNKKIRDIQIKNIEKRDFIKYLGIYIDKNLNWDYQIKHVNNKIAKNTGIINKLRYYLDLKTLKQLYYTLIYPYLNYGLMSWGNTYVTKLNKIQACQNKCVKNMFFASKRENPITYMNLLSILKIDNIFRLKTAVFTYKLINKINNVPIIFINTISTASSQHSYSTRFAKNQNFRRSKARTNYGIFTFRFASSKIWETIPNYIKQSNSISIFKKRYTQFLLSSQT